MQLFNLFKIMKVSVSVAEVLKLKDLRCAQVHLNCDRITYFVLKTTKNYRVTMNL